MANANPIKTKDDGMYPDFIIPKEFRDKTLYLTTITELLKPDWILYLIHGLNIQGQPQDFDPIPDINRKKIGICSELNSIKLSLYSNASRINNGNISPKPSKVKYSIRFEADNHLIDEEFTVISTERNPFTFYTMLTFKI